MGALDCVTADKIKSTDSTEVFTINAASNSCLNEPRRDLESQYSKTSTTSKFSKLWPFAVDILLLCIVVLLLGLFELGVIPSYTAGFYCNDPALSYPFTGDTVSMAVIIISVLLMPVVVFLITEFIFLDSDYLERSRIHQAIRNTLWLYRSYTYGFIFNLGTVEVMKGISGSPRPTFFDICEPDTGKTCNGSEFVYSFTCTSTRFSTWFQNDASHSFPSGHTSLSVYCGFFIAWYLQRRAFHWSHRTVFLVPMVQLTMVSYAALCSLTRMTDNRHHWWDVLVGTAIGVVSLFYAVLVLCENFSYATTKSPDIEESLQSRTLLVHDRRQNGVS